MPIVFPTQGTLQEVFAPQYPYSRPKTQPAPPKRSPVGRSVFPAWSAVEDAKSRASALSDEAVKEFEKASQKAQAKAGHIELYSFKYYAACTFGGLLACVSQY